jgi:hypothetical protein
VRSDTIRRTVYAFDPVISKNSIAPADSQRLHLQRAKAAMMRGGLDPFSFLIVSSSGWMNQHQHQVIEYLVEENRVLREQIGNLRIRFTDNQRRRLAAKAKKLSRTILEQVATIVTAGTAWYW